MLLRFRRVWSRRDASHLAGAQLALVALAAAGVTLAAAPAPRAEMTAAPVPAVLRANAAVAAVETAAEPEAGVIRLQDLDAEAARAWNAANPVSRLPNPPAKPFRLKTESVLDEARAIDCMTAAIYYEAAYESTDGQRAVAQVVLNRMRHPAFPKTVCGVVFQGSERRTGCQFTFTCDGSLARKPAEAGWARARKVAEAALSGYVMKKVGNATHYHANYVAPYWSPNLVKVGTVGAHIFYRWTGGWGLPPAFGGRYAGGETGAVQVATLDSLAKSQAKLQLASVTAEAAQPVSAPVVEAAPAAPAQATEAELVTAAEAVTASAEPLAKPQELDWAGRPKPREASRIALPSQGFGRAY